MNIGAKKRKRKRKINIKKNLRKRVLDRDKGFCWICSLLVADDEVSLDHVIPVSKGGPTNFDNLKLAHKVCNNKRGNGDVAKQQRNQRRKDRKRNADERKCGLCRAEPHLDGCFNVGGDFLAKLAAQKQDEDRLAGL